MALEKLQKQISIIYKNLFQKIIEGQKNSEFPKFAVPIVTSNIFQYPKYHPQDLVIKCPQENINSCCFSILESALWEIEKYLSTIVIAPNIRDLFIRIEKTIKQIELF